MKTIVYSSALALVFAAGSAARALEAGPAQTSGSTAQQRPAEPSQQPAQREARQFIERMAMAGLAEVELGKLAAERAENREVKDFGQLMVKDHSQANKELAKVASQLNIEMPKELDQKHRQLRDRLSKLQGAEFDRAYMQEMVRDHKDVASQLRQRSGKQMTSARPGEKAPVGTAGADRPEQALTQWAAKTLPVIEKHLERARDLEQKVSKGSGR